MKSSLSSQWRPVQLDSLPTSGAASSWLALRMLSRHNGFHGGTHFAVAQASLGLAFELGILDHGGQDAGQPFAEILAREVVVLFLQQADPAGVVVEALGEGRFEAGFVGAALRGVDIVDVGEKALGIAIRILDGGAADDGVALSLDIDDVLLQGVLTGVQVTDVVNDAAVIAEDAGTVFRVGNPLVREGDLYAAVEVGKLLQAAGDGLGMETDVLKDLVIREETHQGAFLPGVTEDFQGTDGLAGMDLPGGGIRLAGEGHAVMGPVEEDVDGEPFAQRIDDTGADAVKAAGIVIILVVEFAARVQNGEDDLHARDVHGRVVVHGHAASVVPDAGGAVLMQGDGYFRREAVGGFVDRVVHDLPQQVVQAAGRGGADIHAGTHADGLETLQHLDIPGIISLGRHGFTPSGQWESPNVNTILYHKM